MRTVVLPLVVLIAGCNMQTPAQKAAQDARDIAQVEAAQENGKPPVKPLVPQPILYMDVVQNKLNGDGCNFVADGGGMGGILMAQAERAFMKEGGKVVQFAADAGSARLPMGAWSRYSGREHALTLTRIESGKPSGSDDRFRGKLVVTDPWDRVVYQTQGDVQCKTT